MPLQVAPIPFFQFGTGFPYLRHEPKITPSFSTILWSGKFLEFYCQNNGSNLNSGNDTNAAAKYSTTNGNWSTTTLQFIPTDGSTPADTVKPGDFVSIYADGATVGGYIARVESVAGGVNGAIQIKSGITAGTAPSTSATARSLKCGGAWKGPSGSNQWPMSMPIDGLISVEGYHPRMNFKNDQTYSMSVGMTVGGGFNNETIVYQGFRDVPGDGGVAIFDWGGAAVTGISFPNANQTFSCALYADFEFKNTGSSNTLGNGGGIFWRCCFHDSNQQLFSVASSTFFYECEFYRGCLTITSNTGWIFGGGATCIRCYFHDATTAAPFIAFSCVCFECIFDTNPYAALRVFDSNNYAAYINFFNCTFYKCATAFLLDGLATFGKRLFGANNLVVNCGTFVSYGGTTLNQPNPGWSMTFFNTGFYGLQGLVFPVIAGLRGAFQSIGEMHYSSNPLVSPDTGDFRLVNPGAIGSGRGNFMQTGLSKTGTVSYPDIGAVQTGTVTGVILLTLRDGFVNQSYYDSASYSTDITASISSGSLPTGLALSQPTSSSWAISGIPTVAGTYTATVSLGASSVVVGITVYADPTTTSASGISGLGGY